jgi:hypothetical protein
VTFTTVPDKTIGDVFTEAMWDSYIRDNLNKGVVRPIADTTLGSAAASIVFSSIAPDYAHLMLFLYGRSDTAATITTVHARLNGDAGANYDWILPSPATETFGATGAVFADIAAATAGANLFGGSILFLPHYAGSTNNKVILALSGNKVGVVTGDLLMRIRAGFWRSSAAINSITLTPTAGNFAAGARATLLGIPN